MGGFGRSFVGCFNFGFGSALSEINIKQFETNFKMFHKYELQLNSVIGKDATRPINLEQSY